MSQLAARVFRSLNAHIITTRFEWVRKPLKVLFLLSGKVQSWSMKKSDGKSHWEILQNFDTDIKLKVDRSRSMGASLYWTGFHELREFIFLHRFLKREMVALDVGANLGEYTLFMAKRLTAGHVISFEPMELIRIQLQENVQLNNFKHVIIFDFGLSDKQQQLQLHEVDDGNEGLGTLFLGDKRSRRSIEITLESLDDKWDSFQLLRLDFIKIDVEGSELFVLQGAKKTIARFRPFILVEISEENFKAAGYHTADVETFFKEINYQAKRVNKEGKLETCVSMPAFGNIMFVPQ
jgi:FkbM family methyltransferase